MIAAPSTRTAERVAAAMIEEIKAAGWAVGQRVGSEAELMVRFAVSRSVIRQAISMLESQGVVRVRNGRGGGVVVSEPKARPFARALELYLLARDVSGDDILEAKAEVELTCVRLATRRRTAESVERLRDAVAREQKTPRGRVRDIGADNVHIVLAEMTGNPALHLFIEALSHLAASCVPQSRAAAAAHETYEQHARIAEAVAGGDEERAVAEMAKHLGVVEEALSRRRPIRPRTR